MNSNKSQGTKNAGGGGGGGGTNKTAKQSNTHKSDSKSDKADLTAKKTPTPEQMQIARIIDTHRIEDPELQKKMKQVMEVTSASEDAASMALHSREYDVEQAITLLTEGGSESLDAEWEQAGKKRKPKVAAVKLEGIKERPGVEGEKGVRERSDKRERVSESRGERGGERREVDMQGDGPPSEFRSRGGTRGGRGGRGGLRGRGGNNRMENNENDQSYFDANSRGRYMNGPSRGGRGRGDRGEGRGRGGMGRDRDGTRTFANRNRGPRDDDFGHHPIDVWENSQANASSDKKPMKVDQWDEFPSAEDWDNEEYTGSLAESKVFTPSTQTSAVPSAMTDGTNGLVTGNASSLTETSPSANHIGASGNVNMIAGLNGTAGPGGVVGSQALDVNLMFQQQQKAQKHGGSGSSTAGANILASLQSSATLQSSYSNATQQGQAPNNQALPQRQKVQRPPRGPMTNMPSSGVEMPDDATAKLDVQFGGLEFGSSGSTFNSVVQHGVKGAGDMLYGSSIQQQKIDSYTGTQAGESNIQSKNISSLPSTAEPFQPQRNLQQGVSSIVGANESMNSKGVQMSPPNADAQNALASSISSQHPKSGSNNSGTKQQQTSYTNTANTSGSAFVSYPGKGAPGFPAPGFPPVSQSLAGNVGAAPYIPTGPVYGSQPNQLILTHPGSYNVGTMSNYGNQPIVTGPVQLPAGISQGIPSQNLGQMPSTYGTGYQYNPGTAPISTNNTNQYGGYGTKLQNSISSPPGQHHQTLKETLNDSINVASSTSVSQHGSSTNLQTTTSTTASSKASGIPSSGVGNSSTATSKVPGSVSTSNTSTISTSTGLNSSGIPPGMVLQPQYIMNQGVPLYGFQGPVYGYDESSVQFLPRLPHPIPAGYFDASGAYVSADAQMRNPNFSFVAPSGSVQTAGRADGSSMQSYQVADGRFTRSDSSTGSPVPSNLPGQTTQPQLYNPLQYVYYGNPGGYPYGPPPMYQTTGMATPTNATSGSQHTGQSHQYQNKNYYGNPYLTSYDTSGIQGGATDYNKSTYSSGVGGPNSSVGKGPSSNTSQSDMASSIYGNKGHLNNVKSFDKQNYGGASSSPYNSLPQQTGNLGGAPYNVYMQAAQPVLPALFTQDGASGQRQVSGQQKGGNKYGPQQYWTGGN